MVEILHAADLHLDSAFASLTEEQARQRRQESRQLLRDMVDFANDHGVQLLLLPGDLFDGERVYAQTAPEMAEALGCFTGQVVIAPGNHDWYSPRSPYARTLWPDNVHIFTGAAMERLSFPQYGCTVYGAAFTGPEMPAPEPFRVPEEDGVTLLVLHGDVAAPGSRYRPLSPEWLAETGADYVALGHVHSCSGVQYAGKTAYAYSGCPEGRGFDELDDKGFLWGRVDRDKAELTFVPFARRRYRILTVDVTDGDPGEKIAQALSGREADICRVRLTGSVDERLSLPGLQQQLQGLAWQLEVRDETRLRQDLWLHTGEESLRGLFLQQMRREYDGADAERQRQILQAVEYGLAAMEGREL